MAATYRGKPRSPLMPLDQAQKASLGKVLPKAEIIHPLALRRSPVAAF